MRLHPAIAAAALMLLAPTAGVAQYAQPSPPPPPPPPPPSYAPPPPSYPPPGYAQPYQQPAPQPYQQPAPRAGPSVNLWVGATGVSDIYGTYGDIRIDGHESYGLSVEVPIRSSQTLELKWIYANQSAQYISHTPAYQDSSRFNAVQQYYMIGSNTVIRRGKVETFFGGSLGALLFQPSNYTQGPLTYNPPDSWHFALGLGGGAKIFVAEKVAIRLGLDVMFPFYSGGSSVYVGGGSMYFSAWVPSVFGQLTAGLTFGG
jgi:opacity protein-like surface antigen